MKVDNNQTASSAGSLNRSASNLVEQDGSNRSVSNATTNIATPLTSFMKDLISSKGQSNSGTALKPNLEIDRAATSKSRPAPTSKPNTVSRWQDSASSALQPSRRGQTLETQTTSTPMLSGQQKGSEDTKKAVTDKAPSMPKRS